MTTKIIVLVADRGDPKHGEVVVLGSAAEAERLVETFLEAGYEKERVRVFAGAEMEAQVSQRPKVELVSRDANVDDGETLPPSFLPDERGVQPANRPSQVQAASPYLPDHEPKNGSSPLFSGSPAQTELMPELLH